MAHYERPKSAWAYTGGARTGARRGFSHDSDDGWSSTDSTPPQSPSRVRRPKSAAFSSTGRKPTFTEGGFDLDDELEMLLNQPFNSPINDIPSFKRPIVNQSHRPIPGNENSDISNNYHMNNNADSVISQDTNKITSSLDSSDTSSFKDNKPSDSKPNGQEGNTQTLAKDSVKSQALPAGRNPNKSYVRKNQGTKRREENRLNLILPRDDSKYSMSNQQTNRAAQKTSSNHSGRERNGQVAWLGYNCTGTKDNMKQGHAYNGGKVRGDLTARGGKSGLSGSGEETLKDKRDKGKREGTEESGSSEMMSTRSANVSVASSSKHPPSQQQQEQQLPQKSQQQLTQQQTKQQLQKQKQPSTILQDHAAKKEKQEQIEIKQQTQEQPNKQPKALHQRPKRHYKQELLQQQQQKQKQQQQKQQQQQQLNEIYSKMTTIDSNNNGFGGSVTSTHDHSNDGNTNQRSVTQANILSNSTTTTEQRLPLTRSIPPQPNSTLQGSNEAAPPNAPRDDVRSSNRDKIVKRTTRKVIGNGGIVETKSITRRNNRNSLSGNKNYG